MESKKIILFWSGGKDSNLTLSRLKKNSNFSIMGLVTILDKESNAVMFHGIPETLIVDQSKLLSIPNIRIYLDRGLSEEEYINRLVNHLSPLLKKELNGIAFGDICNLASKKINEEICSKLNINALFPLWNESSETLQKEYFETNHQAIISAVDKSKMDNSFLAKEYNQEWISRLPDHIDGFGIHDEFHTFATYSPYFKMRIPYSKAIAIEQGPYSLTLLKEP